MFCLKYNHGNVQECSGLFLLDCTGSCCSCHFAADAVCTGCNVTRSWMRTSLKSCEQFSKWIETVSTDIQTLSSRNTWLKGKESPFLVFSAMPDWRLSWAQSASSRSPNCVVGSSGSPWDSSTSEPTNSLALVWDTSTQWREAASGRLPSYLGPLTSAVRGVSAIPGGDVGEKILSFTARSCWRSWERLAKHVSRVRPAL